MTHPRTLAVIGAGSFAVPDAFRRGLARALSRFGQIATVDSATLAAALPGSVDLDSEAVTSWFNRQELRYHYVLYFADAELTPFSAKIIRQADQLLVAGDATEGAPEPSTLERFAFDIHPVSARRLVLIHAARKPLSGTSRWLNARAVAMHHHIVAEDSAGYDRLARFVSGNARGAPSVPPMSESTRPSSRRISVSTCSAARAAAAPWPRPSPWARALTRSARALLRFSWKRVP